MQPVIIQDTISIAANSVNQNVIASNDSLRSLLRLPFNARLTIAFVQSATGLQMDFDAGSDNLIASSNGRVTTSTPEIPLDVVNSDCYAEEGAQLSLRAANTTGGAITLRYIVIAEYVEALYPNARVMQQGPIAIANNTVDFQLLDGLRYERSRVDSILTLLMTQSAAGMFREVYVDMERIAPASTIALTNRIPQDPYDLTVGGIEVPADQLIQVQVTNQSGDSLSAFWKIVLQELVR